ncbi:hypothetical protein H4Q26_009040 [Puccinia striiformis f. sp. tritici PST-130]|nr:hypothetical protein H4Q26_009040 [Puccinia striiformis f. sp. tritici PST-130]
MLGLASSSSGKRILSSSTSTSDLPFFTSTSPLEINFGTIQPQNQFSNHHRSSLISISNSLNQFIKSDWRNSIGRIILKPTYRKNITNFVFLSAFISACICVGAQSVFPNAGFHSNYHHYLKLNHLKNSSMSPKHQEDEEKPRTTQNPYVHSGREKGGRHNKEAQIVKASPAVQGKKSTNTVDFGLRHIS